MKYYVRYDYSEAAVRPAPRPGDEVSRDRLIDMIGGPGTTRLENDAQARGKAVRFIKRRINPCVVVVTA